MLRALVLFIGIIISAVNCYSWEKMNFPDIEINYISYPYIATDDGLYTYNTGDNSYKQEIFGLDEKEILCIIQTEELIFIGTENGIFRSGKVGITWVDISGEIGSDKGITAMAAEANGNILAATRASGIYRTTDGGITWNKLEHPWGLSWVNDIKIGTNGWIYVACGQGVFFSRNAGETWSHLNNGLNYSAKELEVFSIGEFDLIIAGTSGHGIYHSIDEGASWEKAKGEMKNSTITDINATACGLYCSTKEEDGEKPRLLESFDLGANWENADITMGHESMGPEGRTVNAFYFDCASGIYAGTDQGLYYLEDLLPNSVREDSEANISISPNPAKDKLNIILESSWRVNTIAIYDVLGRVRNTYHAHERELNISNLPSGIYLLKIETDDGIISEKVVVE